MNLLYKVLIVTVLGLNLANAGGWVVGGGELIGDNNNPWFLHNTTEVKYCLKLDEQNFGLTRQESERIIAEGFKFWMRQFQRQPTSMPAFPLGRQFFKQVTCDQNPDIQFQFGILDLEQLNNLKDIERKIAFTVRTDYDRVNMKGKGFVYISPESGPLKVQNPRVVERPWSRSKSALAQFVLIHELGHVFGIQHDRNIELMKEDFVEQVVSMQSDISSPSFQVFAEQQLKNLNLFEIARDGESPYQNMSCSMDSIEPIVGGKKVNQTRQISKKDRLLYQKFFNLSDEYGCYGLKQMYSESKYALEILFTATQSKQTKKILLTQKTFPMIRNTNLLKIFLPKEQQLYPGNYNKWDEYLYVGQRQTSVTFKSEWFDGQVVRPVIVSFAPGVNTTVTAEFDGTIYFDIFSSY